jgi:4-carboxymuconolactone decarboxylase
MMATATDRMPPIAPDAMSSEQRRHAEAIMRGPRGALYGPFVPLLRSPQLMDRVQRVGEYLRYHSAIGNTLSELVILITARQWNQTVEWAIHEPIARKAGISPGLIRAIADGQEPHETSGDERIVYDFCSELHRTRSVSDTTYGRALARFGEAGVIDITGLSGYYTLLAMVMNVARTPQPPDTEPAQIPLPE